MYIIGVDVGGTNTDVAILKDRHVIGWSKSLTEAHIIDGVITCILKAVKNCEANGYGADILANVGRVHIGTTHFLNAVIKRKGLEKVSCIRLCSQSTRSLPPFSDFPTDLIPHVNGGSYFLRGGYEFNGVVIDDLHESEIIETLQKIKNDGIRHIAVTGIFSPVQSSQEKRVGQLIESNFKEDFTYTLSHCFGHLGLLERENTTILNESLRSLCKVTLRGFHESLQKIGLKCPVYFTQNDGTLISGEDTLRYPVFTFSSGATNSMRGAAYLSNVTDAIVVDIGGTSTDVGMLVNGFPREASTRIEIGGVNTNFRMPDTKSIGLGGGSHVFIQENKVVDVGPDSVEYRIANEALIFGGSTLVATDIAVAAHLIELGDVDKVKHLDEQIVEQALEVIHRKLETAIDGIKLSQELCPVVLVGGGSILIDENRQIQGASETLKPPSYQVANAVGAALSQISGTYSNLVNITDENRNDVISHAKQCAINNAVHAGATRESCVISDVAEIQLSYVAIQHVRLTVKAFGDLDLEQRQQFQVAEVVSSPEPFQNIPQKKDVTHKDEDVTVQQERNDSDDNIDESLNVHSGVWHVSLYDAKCLTIGAGILGCGGGGSPYLGSIGLMNAIKQGKIPKVVHPNSIRKDASVFSPAYMGAPGVFTEKISTGTELVNVVRIAKYVAENNLGERNIPIEQLKDRAEKLGLNASVTDNGDILTFECDESLGSEETPDYLMPCEVGGLNTLEPLILGAQLDVPIVDCDGMGRAFPQLQQFSPFISGFPPYPAVIADSKGRIVCCLKINTAKDLEKFFRDHCIAMGCVAGICLAQLGKDNLSTYCIQNSISKARNIGNAVLQARKQNTCPVSALVSQLHGRQICEGKISDVQRATVDGFAKGRVIIEPSQNPASVVAIDFQNEFTYCKNVALDSVIATVPDLIAVVATETGEPVTTDELKYGLRVSVIVAPCDPLMSSTEALKATGPKAFGYDIEYQSIGEYVPTESLLSPS